jgi:hypothetical protein
MSEQHGNAARDPEEHPDCPDHHKMFCTCMKRHASDVKARKEDIADNAYESLGFIIDYSKGGYTFKVENHPELTVSIYGKWKLNGVWRKGIGKLREYIRLKSGGKPKRKAKKKTRQIAEIANRFGDVDVRKGLPSSCTHLRSENAIQVLKRYRIKFARALVGFENVNQRFVPKHLGVVVFSEHITPEIRHELEVQCHDC